jgi:hypothetical protein
MVSASQRLEVDTAAMSPWPARLRAALQVVTAGNTAIVIVPLRLPKQAAINALVSLLGNGHPLKPYVRATTDALHFEGTRGQVRVYPCDHITYDPKQRRLLDYPHGTPTFLHPEVAT